MRRNQIIIAALVVMICVAGYLNFLDTRNAPQDGQFAMTDAGEIGAIILDGLFGSEVAIFPGQNGLGFNEDAVAAGATPGDTNNGTGAAVFVNATGSAGGDNNFFVQARLGREQDRSRQKESLRTVMNSPDLDQVTRNLGGEAILELTRRMEAESAAETALLARGFGESYVRIDDNWVEVIISKATITDQELAMIEDIIMRNTGANINQIRLSTVRQ
ncbi:MAG: SpoIIIAH-like family protein [Defluviitaleaceae bacterium]|nr:SpoIIIAH-like family protein [Defluviitaleaceae bacterium]